MCQKVVGGISLLLGVLGLVTLAFGAMSSGGTPDAFKSMAAKMPKGSIPSSGGGPILGLGVVIMVTSVLGCATAKFKNPCFAIPFGILTLIFGLILLIIGFLAMAISSPQVLAAADKSICGGNSAQSPFLQWDTKYNEMVVKPMCSEICPCDPDMFAAWKATKPALQGTNRSWTQNSSQRAAQNKNGIGAGTVLLQAAKKGEKSYKDFMTCYNEVLSTKPADAKNNGEKMKAWFKENGAEGLAKMEKEMDCSGACKTPLFYVTRPFNEQPELVCTKAFVKKIGSAARTAGIVSIITALVSFCAFCGSFPLCTAFNDEEGEGAKSAER